MRLVCAVVNLVMSAFGFLYVRHVKCASEKKFKLMKIVLLKDSVIIPRMLRRSDHDKMFNEYATCFISSHICAKFCAYRNVCGASKSFRGEFSKNH